MKNKFLITISATAASMFALALTAHGAVTANIFANAGAGQYHLSDGSTLATGDLLRFGTFNLVAYNALSAADQNSFSAVDSVFTELGVSTSNVSGEFFSVGAVISGATTGDQLYTWVFNNSVGAAATEWGIFSSDNALWTVPEDPGSATLSNATINQFVAGEDFSGQERLVAVPEPSVSLLGLLGAAFLIRRRR